METPFRTSDVADALDRLGRGGALGGFVPVLENSSIAGSAFPILVKKSRSKGMREGLTKAIEAAPAGSVLVISSDSDRFSVWGGHMSRLAQGARLKGIVVSGCIRDVDEIREIRLPVFAKTRNPVSGYGRLEVASAGEPVEVDGVAVRRGDWVIADSDGVAFVSKRDVEEVKRRIAVALEAEAWPSRRKGRRAG